MAVTDVDERAELQRVLHELQLQQAELEMQNHQLIEAQRLLEESRRRYADFYDCAPIGYCIIARDGTIREINLVAAAILGMPRDLLLGRPFVLGSPTRHGSVIESHLRRCFAGETKVTADVPWPLRDQSPGVVQLISCPIRDDAGVITGCRTALIDVSAEKEGEARLRLLAEAGEAFASSLDHKSTLAAVTRLAVPSLADVCFIDLAGENGLERLDVVTDPHRVIAAATERIRALRTTPSPQQEVIRSGRSLLIEELSDSVGDEYANTMRELGITSTMIVPLEARDRVFGSLTLLSTRRARRYSEGDRLFAEDIGRRAAMAIDNASLYEHVQTALRARDAVLAVVSHDLRNPLAVIRLHAAGNLKRPKEDDRRLQARESFEAIQRAARTMDQLIRDLLDVASMDAGHISIHAVRVGVASLVREAVQQAAPLAREKQLRLSMSLDAAAETDAGDVICDHFRILQVFTNLLDNAIKFTPPGGSVTVRAMTLEQEVRFSVEDTGPGIPEQDRERIFEPFFQAQADAHGKGLGLSIADGIVRAHGGHLSVESGPGGGACFQFMLRRALTDGPSIASAPSAEPVTGGSAGGSTSASSGGGESRIDALLTRAH